MAHPRDVLLGAQGATAQLPVCDHYCGVEARMTKSLQLQANYLAERGACLFDVTLDCEDGAPVGGELEQAHRVAALAMSVPAAQWARSGPAAAGPRQRIGVRLHPVDHPVFAADVDIVVGEAASALSFIMIPKVESVADVRKAVQAIDAATPLGASVLPIHVLIESPAAVQQAFAIAAEPRVQSISFGLMDFVSAHGGAIRADAMTVRAEGDSQTLDQFHHPLVVRAKLEVAAACHAHGKVPSHCVVTEFRDVQALGRAARTAAQAFGYTRMWSIHPDQIVPIVTAFSPDAGEIASAVEVIEAAAANDWAPVSVAGKLHDRASFRYFWQVIERAQQTGCTLPDAVHRYF